MFRIKGVIQHYSWGGFKYIPELLNMANGEKKPFAEYWLGAHPNYPSTVESDPPVALDHYLARNQTSNDEATLPFLLKVLDVRNMLSIQVHPDKENAAMQFRKEEELGIPRHAPHRNYKDDNHKPEMMVALGDFWLLHGFKPQRELLRVLRTVPEFGSLATIFESEGYKALYEKVMTMAQPQVNEILQPLLQRIVPMYENGDLQKSGEDFWAARASVTFSKGDDIDRGIFSIYFFNLVQMKKGEGLFQPAGLPHAYLEGQNIEVMANSDNVLRAGLTDKHIDIAELLLHVRFEKTDPQVLDPVPDEGHRRFETTATEFELHQYQFEPGDQSSFNAVSAGIILLIQGEIELSSGPESLVIKKGEAVLVTPGENIQLKAVSPAVMFRVAVPGA